MLVAIIGELDVVSGAGGDGDLLELEAAGSRHQISGHFSDQVPVSWGIFSVILYLINKKVNNLIFIIRKFTVSGN